MKSKCLNFMSVSVGVTAIVILTLGILGGGSYLLKLLFGDLLRPVPQVIQACFNVMVLCVLVWLSLGTEASMAMGKLLFLTAGIFAALAWLVTSFRIWPPYAMYVVPFVSVYLVVFLFPRCLDGFYDAQQK